MSLTQFLLKQGTLRNLHWAMTTPASGLSQLGQLNMDQLSWTLIRQWLRRFWVVSQILLSFLKPWLRRSMIQSKLPIPTSLWADLLKTKSMTLKHTAPIWPLKTWKSRLETMSMCYQVQHILGSTLMMTTSNAISRSPQLIKIMASLRMLSFWANRSRVRIPQLSTSMPWQWL